MVIHDLDILWPIGSSWPLKADAPLVINPDAVLSVPVAAQRFQPVASQISQVAQADCRFKNPEPLFGLPSEAFERKNPFAFSKTFSSPVPIASNQTPDYY